MVGPPWTFAGQVTGIEWLTQADHVTLEENL
jgi:hypothetical protein